MNNIDVMHVVLSAIILVFFGVIWWLENKLSDARIERDRALRDVAGSRDACKRVSGWLDKADQRSLKARNVLLARTTKERAESYRKVCGADIKAMQEAIDVLKGERS